MKMYLNEQQTAKLIELGFEEPKIVTEISWQEDEKDEPIINANTIEYTRHYSIGELLSFLPRVISNKKFNYATINIFHDSINWVVGYDDVDGVMRFITSDIELIDALCVLCRKLKEEGVI